jgi:Ig-like domain-containing protein
MKEFFRGDSGIIILKRRTFYGWMLGLALLVALACNMPGAGGSNQPDLTPSATTDSGVVVPAAGVTASPGAAGEATGTLCPSDATFVSDVTIPDNTEIPAGSAFVKVWRIKSDGCQPWPTGTTLIYTKGTNMAAVSSVPAPAAAPGASADLSVAMIAPATPGTYESYWQLQTPTGARFGPEVYIKIKSIAATATPAPPTPTATATLPPAAGCGDGTCNGSETLATCPQDCGLILPPVVLSYCGDGVCNGSETFSSCPADCTLLVIPLAFCGDGTCNGSESTSTCPGDCGTFCGDGACNGSETIGTCAADCLIIILP